MSQRNRQRLISGVALAVFYLFAYQMGAFGGTISGCNVCAVQAAPLVRAAAFTYQAPIVGGYYMPAEALQQRAAAQMQMEASAELAEFQAFQRFRQYESWRAQQPQSPPATEPPAEPPASVTEPPTAPGAGPLPPPTDPGEPGAWGGQYPTLMAKCSKCHSGADPDGGFILDGTEDLKSPHLDGKRNRIMAEIVNDRMPRKAGTTECVPLTPEEMGAVIAELWLE